MVARIPEGSRARTVVVALLLAAACGPPPGPPPVLAPRANLRLVDAEGRSSGTRTLSQRFFDWSRAFTGESGRSRAFVGHDLRDVLWLRAPGSFVFRLSPRPGDRLRFGAGVAGSEALRFVAAIEDDHDRRVVAEIEPGGKEWEDAVIDLDPWAGRTVTVELTNPDGPRGALALWGNPRVGSARPDGRPNVILYLIDTLRADHLGAYGYPRPTSPVLDDLAADGALFERCYAHDAQTLGSIPSLLTSLYTPTHGVDAFGERIGAAVPTLAEQFRAAGYQTASFVTNVNAGVLPGLDRGFDELHDAARSYRDKEALRSLPEEDLTQFLDRVDGGPFFAYVHTAEPHRPYTPPPPLDTLFDPDYDGPVTGHMEGEAGYLAAESPRDVAHVVALYDGEVALADRGVGRLLRVLEERGLRERTILLVTSDHGEELKDHGAWNHGQSLHGELMHVPLILAGPGVPAGARVDAPAQLLDVAPTLLALAGLPVPDSFQGDSLAELMRDEGVERFRERPIFARASREPRMSAVIRGRYKAIVHDDGALELYDLEADPGETRDLAPSRPRLAAELRGRVDDWLEAALARQEAAEARELSDDDRDRLRALGYLP